ncbi:hypothetical protein FF100_04670 [Methylobacterium terricola]|uniref:Uncharacterized protein n=1 Tax=Methylobacterium terricola TaxID=2583531 RepID=A0A5C4LK58_9HYPH|nr:hypothetical protein [Methylobacterium terricola]TNC14876.1 hypothetical protein FF100_04670 [Methylobacterium terricola]
MIGTLLIAVPGYGMATLFLLASISALIDGVNAPPKSARRAYERRALFGCVALAIIFAAVTRWLLGGAL